MRGFDSFSGTRIFQHFDSQQRPFGQAGGPSGGSMAGQTHWSTSNQTHWRGGNGRGRAPASAEPASDLFPARDYRASSDDRTQVTELLQAHYVAGRLDATELEARVARALAAVTLADLDAVLADLPPLQSSQAQPQVEPPMSAAPFHADLLRCTAAGPKPFHAHAISYVLVMAMLVVIWAMTTPGGYFWPIWPMLGWGIGLASHGLAARSTQQSGQQPAQARGKVTAGYR